jgi:hypothetical protein
LLQWLEKCDLGPFCRHNRDPRSGAIDALRVNSLKHLRNCATDAERFESNNARKFVLSPHAQVWRRCGRFKVPGVAFPLNLSANSQFFARNRKVARPRCNAFDANFHSCERADAVRED